MGCDTDLLWYYIDLIKNDSPKTSVERIRYIKNVNMCYGVIDGLYITNHDYMVESMKSSHYDYRIFVAGDEISKSLNKSQCRKIKDLYSNKCAICDFPVDSILEVHHIIPKNICGKNDVNNLIALCPTCHVIFHDIEQKRFINTELKQYLVGSNQLDIVIEYTKHLVDEKQSYQTSFSVEGRIMECKVGSE